MCKGHSYSSPSPCSYDNDVCDEVVGATGAAATESSCEELEKVGGTLNAATITVSRAAKNILR